MAYPLIYKDSLLPIPKTQRAADTKDEWWVATWVEQYIAVIFVDYNMVYRCEGMHLGTGMSTLPLCDQDLRSSLLAREKSAFSRISLVGVFSFA